MRCVITGTAVVLPGVDDPGLLFASGPQGAAPVQPASLIGGKGLRYKDRATQLAYYAARSALRDSGLLHDDALTVPAATVGVVASSNFGNVDTVCQTMTTIAGMTASGTRPMDLPNASSNVVASSIAIRFGLRGPNVMVCNGATSGLDAVYLATLMLTAHRVPRILVVGVEPDNPEVREITGGQTLDGAAAFVLEDPAEAARRGASVRAEVGGHQRAEALDALLEDMARLGLGRPALWQLPEGGAAVPPDLLSGVPRHDLSRVWGITSGALGALQCTAAVGWFGRGGAGPVYAVAGDPVAGPVAGVVLSAPDPHRANATEDGTHAEADAPLRLRRANALPDTAKDRMLLLHGLGSSATAWSPYVDEHKSTYEIWSADLPWRGDGQAAWCYHRDPRGWLAQAVRRTPPPLDIVVAHSFSANTLLHWLDDEFARGNDPLAGPAAPRGLVLVSPFFRDSPQDFDWASLTDSVEAFPRLADEGIQAHLRATSGRELTEPLRQELAMARCERVGPYAWAQFFASYLATPWLRTSLITVPCLVVVGEHDAAASPAEAALLAARLPHANLRVLPGCGHFAMIDRPTHFASVIDEFVATLPPSTRV